MFSFGRRHTNSRLGDLESNRVTAFGIIAVDPHIMSLFLGCFGRRSERFGFGFPLHSGPVRCGLLPLIGIDVPKRGLYHSVALRHPYMYIYTCIHRVSS